MPRVNEGLLSAVIFPLDGRPGVVAQSGVPIMASDFGGSGAVGCFFFEKALDPETLMQFSPFCERKPILFLAFTLVFVYILACLSWERAGSMY